MQTHRWLAPFILAATFSAQAWETNNMYGGQPYARTGMNNGFGFSMGFSGRSNGRNSYANRPITLRGVNFNYDSAELTPESSSALDKVASNLCQFPGLSIEIVGHASSEGNVAYNMDLSVRRASTVRDYLLKQGVKTENLRATGYGELQPVVSNEVEQGRAINRRVELRHL
jgi:outer membrane protein OmpA-like peptidoglycan-associated protein